MKYGKLSEQELSELTVVELKGLAVEYEVEIQSGWRKSQIIDALMEKATVELPKIEEPPLPTVSQSVRVQRIQEMKEKSHNES